MIKVIGFKVRTHDKVYEPGDTISIMSPGEEDSLISDGYAERIEDIKEESPAKDKDTILTAEELIKIIEASDIKEDIEKILVDELANKRRKTVLAAAAAKIETLSADDKEDDNNNNNDDGKGTNSEDAEDLVKNFNASDMVVGGEQK